MPLVNSITGTFAMDKVKAQTPDGKTKKVTEYSFVIGGQKFAAPKDVAQKMFAALSGRKVFNTTFKYQFTPYDFAVSQSGLPAEVVCMLDYGREKFVKCNVCGNDFLCACRPLIFGKHIPCPRLREDRRHRNEQRNKDCVSVLNEQKIIFRRIEKRAA